MDARQIEKGRVKVSDTSFVDVAVWELPRKLPGSEHRFKYRLAFVTSGKCVVRYDNETGKGDHKHLGRREHPYQFISLDKLLADFCPMSVIGGGNMKVNMNILEVRIETREQFNERFKAAFKGRAQGPFYTFLSYAQMVKTLSAKRQEIVEAMCGKGELTVRGVARLVDRDVKAVHADVKALLLVGILDKGEKGGVIFPYEGIHFDFLIGKPAKKAA